MQAAQLAEANAILQRCLVNLLRAVPAQSGASVDQLRTDIGALQSSALTDIAAGQVGAAIAQCFVDATAAGATFDTMDRVRAACRAENPVFLPGMLLAAALVRFAIIQEVVLLNEMTFTSRQQIDTYINRMIPIFDDAELYAAQNLDQADYTTILALYSASMTDLTTRQRPLPAMVTYTFGAPMPALWLAQRLYGDPTRAQELVAEGAVVHPLFMPPSGLCLSE